MIGVYFSGTGNTKYCVEQYVKAYEQGSTIVSIETADWIKRVQQEDTFVFGYPIYYSSLPKLVSDCIHQHRTLWAGKKIFILCTMGLFSGDGCGCAARIFKQYGAEIVGGLHVKMPDCISDSPLLKKSLETNKEIVDNAKKLVQDAAHSHKQQHPKQDGLGFCSHIAGLFGQRLWFHHKVKDYSNACRVNASLCIGCGQCAKLCPMNNITMQNGHAVPHDHCTLCYRCVNHCPQKAITLLGQTVIEQSLIEHYISE